MNLAEERARLDAVAVTSCRCGQFGGTTHAKECGAGELLRLRAEVIPVLLAFAERIIPYASIGESVDPFTIRRIARECGIEVPDGALRR